MHVALSQPHGVEQDQITSPKGIIGQNVSMSQHGNIASPSALRYNNSIRKDNSLGYFSARAAHVKYARSTKMRQKWSP